MFSCLGKTASTCLRPSNQYANMNRDSDDDLGGDQDTLLWCRDLQKHSHGEFSFTVVQANKVLEDQSQVETNQHATFVGVYDGHGGPEASRFISDHLFHHLNRLAREKGSICEDTIRSAFSATENGFLSLVRREYKIKPLLATVGSCCLVGLIWNGTLYVANLGDSRAIIGYLGKSNKIFAEQLTQDHNANVEEVRQELRSLHPEESHIVVMKHGVWRVKGIIQISRSIGDAYLKKPEFRVDASFPRFHLPEPLRQPVLTADPSICTRVLQPNDKFLIFASDGLWEHLTNQEAAEIVNSNPRMGIARRLLKSALIEAARKREISYDDLKKVDKGTRRYFHDDITIVVIFIDHKMLENVPVPDLSIRAFIDAVGPSNFNLLQDGNAETASSTCAIW